MNAPSPERHQAVFESPKVSEAPKAAPRASLKDKLPAKRKLIAVAVALVMLGGAWEAYKMFTTEGTDDAFVTGHIHPISSRVAGTAVQVVVNDNQQVKQGDVLVRLDPRDYELALLVQRANYTRAAADLARFGSQTRFDAQTQLIYDNSLAQKATAEANYQQAQLNLDYTTVRAPADGYIGKRTVEIGQRVQPGQALMAVVSNEVWVVANFKESQLGHMRPGQPVKIEIDSIPQKDFEGKVDSIAPATGASFALLPPDNATGNFTKVVQRVPVKIVFDSDSVRGFENSIRQGLSAVVSVKVR